MSTTRRYFYVINIKKDSTPLIYAFINTLRLIASPHTKNEAHVTVRGPKNGALNDKQKNRYNEKLKDKSLIINGVGRFFNPGQNTVYLSCRPNELEGVWNKPDYDRMKPHLTIYDGKSRKFARRIFDDLNSNDNICFSVDSIELEKMVSEKKVQKSVWGLKSKVDKWMIRMATGRKIDYGYIRNADYSKRKDLISEVWGKLGSIEKEVKGCIREKDLEKREDSLKEEINRNGRQREAFDESEGLVSPGKANRVKRSGRLRADG